jgi:putative sterol carrier protein
MSDHSLISTLREFSVKVNGNQNLQKLLRGWSPVINVQSTDDDENCALVVREQRVEEVREGVLEHSHEIIVQGNKELLCQVFSGAANPAQAVLDGGLVVYGSDTDAVKLDAITLVLWGM